MHTVSLQFCMLDAIKCIGLVDLGDVEVDDYDMDSGVMMGFLSFELKLALLASNYSCNHNIQ